MKSLFSLMLLTLACSAQASECELNIDSNDQMRFSTATLTVPVSCQKVTLTLTHSGKLPKNVMGHNWLLSKTEDMPALVQAASAAGPGNNYIPADDKRVLAATGLVGGGESTSVSFSTEGLAGLDLTFFCSFPGHWALMKGSFVVSD